MSIIKNYEELEVWKASMDLAQEIYRHTNSELFSRDFGLKDQVRRSAVSVPSNIAEGFERDSKRQFLYFLTIAKGSCGELRTQMRIAQRIGYISQEHFEGIYQKCASVENQLGGFRKYLIKAMPNK
jgi:four helix bundle protein